MDETRLAIDGGTPVRREPFAPWPYYAPDEIAAATEPLATGRVNYWTGQEGRAFEEEYARYTGSRYAVALANGTVALELALYALGIGPGDEVITTSRTFIASASCVITRGATPVLVDVDRDSQNLTAETIRRKLSSRTKAIIAVHLAGWPCDMDPILTLAREHGLKVIEDCAQCHGATYKGRPVGTFGDIGAFSFCQDKIISTGGEGGLLTMDDESLWEKAWAYKDHGKSWSAVYRQAHPPGFRWVHESFGSNYRLTESQSAIGRVQLRKLDGWVAVRRKNAQVLTERFSEIELLRLTLPPREIDHSYYKYYAFLRAEMLRPEWSRERIIEAVEAEGIPCYSGSCSEIYLEKAFTDAGLFDGERLPVARELGETSLLFLVHPTLSGSDMHDTAAAVAKVLKIAAR